MNETTRPGGPSISVIMVDGSYRPHAAILECLKRQSLPAGDFEVLWIEYYDRPKAEAVARMQGRESFQAIALGESGTYHAARCFNEGIRRARGALLVIPDADVLFAEDFLETIWLEHKAASRLAMYIYRLDEPPPAVPGGHPDLERLQEACVLTNPNNYGGCLTVRKEWLLAIDGYEEHEVFRTGGDHAGGRDVYTRLKNLGLPIMWHRDLRMFHPWHPHTPGHRQAFQLQRIMIEHRAQTLDILPYRGLQPERHRPLPPELEARLAAERQNMPTEQK